jgi:predicted ester cyclase
MGGIVKLLAVSQIMNQGSIMEKSPKSIVLGFINKVRSGKEPESAAMYMAEKIKAHQIISGKDELVIRTPENYTEHIHEFLECYGQYSFEVQEMLCEENKVYVRWKQSGQHLTSILGFEPTGKPLITLGSAVYLVENGLIVEYWIQQENQGLLTQLQSNYLG